LVVLLFIFLFGVGAAIGSFLNVVIYRMPREDGWRRQLGCLVAPGSHCPGCDKAIAWYDNVPLLGYVLLRGRCRSCGERISPRYPLVEGFTAALFVLAGWKFGFNWILLPSVIFISVLIAVFFIDLEHYIIPNIIVLPAALAGLALMIAVEPGRWLELLIAGVASTAFFFLIAFVKPGGMGMGDVKLAGMMGFYLGKSVLVALFLGFLLGAVVGVAMIASGRKGRQSRVPFGPFLAIGGIVALFFGHGLLETYLGVFDQSM
jgi:leader peptidase (prepilin peptidase)/N-methyltransferase